MKGECNMREFEVSLSFRKTSELLKKGRTHPTDLHFCIQPFLLVMYINGAAANIDFIAYNVFFRSSCWHDAKKISFIFFFNCEIWDLLFLKGKVLN